MRIEAAFIRLIAVIWSILLFCNSAFSQTYTISTFAGGGVPDRVVGTSFFVETLKLSGIAADHLGNIFFGYKDCVFRMDGTSGLIVRVAGTGFPGFSGDQGPAVLAQFSQVIGVALDSEGNLYVSDYFNNRIRKISKGIVSTIAGGGEADGGIGDGGPATRAFLSKPYGVAVDSAGNVFVSDAGNFRVRMISNGVITTVAGNGTEGSSGDNGPAVDAQFMRLSGVAVDSAGNLYIADTLSGRVRKVSHGVITNFAGTGGNNGGPIGDGGPATSAYFVSPTGLATDVSGNIYLSASGRIRKIANGVITTIAGTGNQGFGGDGGPAVNADLSNPQGIALDPAGNLYFVDLQNYRIRKVSNGIISTVVGYGDSNGFSGSDGPGQNATFTGPYDVFISPAGDVYFSAGYQILKSSNGVVTVVAGDGTQGFGGDNGPAALAQLSGHTGLAMDSNGAVYFGDNNRIRKVTSGVIATVLGNGVSGIGDGGPAIQAQAIQVWGIALDGSGDIYFSDLNENAIRKISNGVVTRFAGTYKDGYSGDNGPALDAQIFGTAQIAFGPSGDLYIADTFNHCIRRILNGTITTVAGNGTAGFSGDSGPATSAQLNYPYGVTVDTVGNIYIADSQNHRIRKVSNGIIGTIAGTGDPVYSGDGGPATGAGMALPVGVGVDADGNVYVADSGAGRMRILRPAGSLCKYAVSPGAIQFPSSGGSFNVSVQTTPSCSWSIAGVPDWISYSAASAGFHLATVSVSVGPNIGVQRTSTISIAGTLVQVTQSSPPPAINDGAIVNAASSAVGAPLAPGSLATAYGEFFLDGLQQATSTPLPGSLGGLALLFNNTLPAGLIAVTGGQANFQLPWELAGHSSASLSVAVNGQNGAPKNVNLAPFAPGIFSTNGQGTGQGAILDSSYRLVDSLNPATAGTTSIQIFCTGLGAVSNQPLTGWPALSDPLSYTDTRPTVTIGGADATVSFSGLAPGTVGLYQVNALVPAGSAKGSAVRVTISMGSSDSNTVTIAVQ